MLRIVSSSLAWNWPGTGWFSGMSVQTTPVAAVWCDPSSRARSFLWEALVNSQFSSPDLILSFWTKPSSGFWVELPEMFSVARVLSRFWITFGTANSVTSHWDRRSIFGAYQLRSLWGFQFFRSAFVSVSDRLKSHSTKVLQLVFTLLPVMVAPERLSLQCEVCCAELSSCAWILDRSCPMSIQFKQKRKLQRGEYIRTKSWGCL